MEKTVMKTNIYNKLYQGSHWRNTQCTSRSLEMEGMRKDLGKFHRKKMTIPLNVEGKWVFLMQTTGQKIGCVL